MLSVCFVFGWVWIKKRYHENWNFPFFGLLVCMFLPPLIELSFYQTENTAVNFFNNCQICAVSQPWTSSWHRSFLIVHMDRKYWLHWINTFCIECRMATSLHFINISPKLLYDTIYLSFSFLLSLDDNPTNLQLTSQSFSACSEKSGSLLPLILTKNILLSKNCRKGYLHYVRKKSKKIQQHAWRFSAIIPIRSTIFFRRYFGSRCD